MEVISRGSKLRKAIDFWDFIDVRLYDHPEHYTMKDMSYWMWSEKKQEYQEYHTKEGLTWEYLKNFINILYVERKD